MSDHQPLSSATRFSNAVAVDGRCFNVAQPPCPVPQLHRIGKITTLVPPPGLASERAAPGSTGHASQLADPSSTRSTVVKHQRRLGHLDHDHPHMLVTARPRRSGLKEVMSTYMEERNPAAVAARVDDQVAQRPRRPTWPSATWPSATWDRWTSRRSRRGPNWLRASSAGAVPWPRRRRVTYKQVTKVVDLHAKDFTGPSWGGQP